MRDPIEPAKGGTAPAPRAAPHPDATAGPDRTSKDDLVARIAAALGLSPGTVFQLGRSADDRVQALADSAELLRLFDQIEDRCARHDCLAYVRAVLAGTGTPAEGRAGGPRS